MNLPFKIHFPNGEPTYFIEKILASLFEKDKITRTELVQCKFDVDVFRITNCKHHTIKKGKRWKAGDKIHFCTGLRTKNYKRFAPIIQVKSVQDIEIKHIYNMIDISIDSKEFGWMDKEILKATNSIVELSQNDGLTIEQFANWFDTDFEGQIIHWTDLRY